MRLTFLSGGAANGIVARVAKDAGIEVGGTFGPVGAMRDKLLAGEACDLVILTHAQIAGLTASGHVDPAAVSDLGTVQTSVAVRTDSPPVDVSTPEGLRAALLAADAIHFPDPLKATAGIHFAQVMDALGISAAVASKLHTHPGGLPAMAAVAASPGNPIGVTQATEIAVTAGVRLVAPLPAPHGLATVYTAAVSAKPQDRNAARGFLTRLSSREAAALRAQMGFEGALVRRATRADEGAIRELVFAILAKEYAIQPEPDGTDLDLFDLDAHYFTRGGMFDVAIDPSGALVGCCGTYATDAQSCELRKMYVRRDARGQGLAKRLLERAIAFARARKCERLELETASVLKEAIAMYEKAGFTRQVVAPHVQRCDRVYSLALK
jgi:molybdate transport system substrate-binding protein